MIQLETIPYLKYNQNLPQDGKHIIGSETQHGVIVYQAYRPAIANFAVDNQFFGGEFKLSRMSWIKTNFLWMMYRSGWASKQGQENILAIEIPKSAFFEIVKEAIPSSFDKSQYSSQEIWKQQLISSDVRLQWDPDHDPYGKKLNRKAIQLGLKGNILKKYAQEWVLSIQDITSFVVEQRKSVSNNDLTTLKVINEKVIEITLD